MAVYFWVTGSQKWQTNKQKKKKNWRRTPGSNNWERKTVDFCNLEEFLIFALYQGTTPPTCEERSQGELQNAAPAKNLPA